MCKECAQERELQIKLEEERESDSDSKFNGDSGHDDWMCLV